MQIPPTSSASQAASIAAQTTAKESSTAANQTASSVQTASNAALEKSNEASPDRDAQGQGDGLAGDEKKRTADELELSTQPEASHQPLPPLDDQPPDQLDIVG